MSRLFGVARRTLMAPCALVRLASELATSRAAQTSLVIVVVLPTLLWWIL